jgi:hypothetical protein
MKKNNSSCNEALFYFLVFLTFLLICLIIYYFYINKTVEESLNNEDNEHFDGFSPFNNKQANCDKENDQEQLQKLVAQWETPYNKNNMGYENAGPMDLPPLNKIQSYPTFNFAPSHGPEGEKIFNYTDTFNDNAEIDGYDLKLIPNNIITA